MDFEYEYYNVDRKTMCDGLTELAKDYLNTAMKIIENIGGPRDVVRDIMVKYYSTTPLVRERGGHRDLESMDNKALEIDDWMERK